MINKEFINNLYDIDTLPAYNYYKADDNIKYLLKDKTIKINEVQEIRLHELHNEFREWVALNLYNKKYRYYLSEQAHKVGLQNKLEKIKIITELLRLRQFDFVLVSDAFSDDELKRLKKQLSSCSIPFIPTYDLLLDTMKRGIKGVEFEIATIAKDQKREVNFNYIEEVARFNVYKNMNLRPMDLTLSEWINYQKITIEDAK